LTVSFPIGRIMPIDPDDIGPLEQRHRDAMLDLVLAWGSLDGALGVLLSRARGVPLHEGAQQIRKLNNPAKLTEVRKILRDAPGGADAARIMEKHEENYELHSFPRNRIAHSHCAGVSTRDRDVILFLTFAKAGDNELALNRIPIEVMKLATSWGQGMTDLALKLADAWVQEA
jgi:hypothetical protein